MNPSFEDSVNNVPAGAQYYLDMSQYREYYKCVNDVWYFWSYNTHRWTVGTEPRNAVRVR